MLTGFRPTVMISSTIGELAEQRRFIAEGLEAASVADGWLFEIHATAAGQPVDETYLQVSRSCDIYVIIIAAEGSEATAAEYEAAYLDNPRKVLPFFVGDATKQTHEIRELIDGRHTRGLVRELADIAPAVVAAVTEHVQTGEVARLSLESALDGRLRRAEEVVRGHLPLSFIPTLVPTEDSRRQESMSATSVSGAEKRVLLEGIGGSGKSYAALAMVHFVSRLSGLLPVVVHPAVGHLALDDVMIAAFESVRYFPGEEGLHDLAHAGRIALVIDRVDALPVDHRRIFLEGVHEFSTRYPRCLVICCLRRSLPDELESFSRFQVAPLSNAQTADMFKSVNAPHITEFPPQVADLARWPLWAWALVEVGASATTGLELLAELMHHRVRSSGAYGPIEVEMLLTAAEVLAHRVWPEPATGANVALDVLSGWRSSDEARNRFDVPTAQSLIERLGAAGVVQVADDIAFAHPLFATYLAADRAAQGDDISEEMAADPEFAMFVAALLPVDQRGPKLTLLCRHGPVGQARYLRLVAEGRRTHEPDDVFVFGEVLMSLTGSAADCVVTDSWTAWRKSVAPAASAPDVIDGWLRDGETTFLQGNVFQHRDPLDVATIAALARFKHEVSAYRPYGDRFNRLNEGELKKLRRLPRSDLDELIIQSALDWRQDWRDQAAIMGVASLPEIHLGEGDPVVTVYEEWPDPGLRIEWGTAASVTWTSDDAGQSRWNYRPLSGFLDPGRSARIHEELIKRAERALGCRFGSEAWARPEYVAAWAW